MTKKISRRDFLRATAAAGAAVAVAVIGETPYAEGIGGRPYSPLFRYGFGLTY